MRAVKVKRSSELTKPLTGRTRVVAVFGYPVHHSLSPGMHNAAFQELGLDYVYVPFNVIPDNLENALEGVRALGIVGVNLTIPHKERAVELLDSVSPEALPIGSVNTVHNVDGVLNGYSTDGEGFMRSLEAEGRSATGSRAVVLGAGGSARAVTHALAAHGAQVSVVNRTASRAEALVEQLSGVLHGGQGSVRAIALDGPEARDAVVKADLLVNCTSVGMHPNEDAQPVPSEWLHDRLFVYDLIYNPLKTRLVEAAEAAGARGANGVGMLVYQGAISFEIWTGRKPPTDVMRRAVLSGLCPDGPE